MIYDLILIVTNKFTKYIYFLLYIEEFKVEEFAY